MMKAIENRKSSIGISHSVSGTIGKAAVLMGVGAVAVPLLAALLPGGTIVWAMLFVIAGMVFAE